MFFLLELFKTNTQQTSYDWTKLLTPAISIITLFFNILFYIIIAPRISFKFNKKTEFYKCSSEFLEYLSDVVSLENFENVPTKIRKYSLSIHLFFKDGTAPEPLNSILEDLFQSAKTRKSLLEETVILEWSENFRMKVRQLRKELSKYTGVF